LTEDIEEEEYGSGNERLGEHLDKILWNGMRTSRTSQVNRRIGQLERKTVRNLSSENAKPELGMDAVVERVQI